MGLEFILWVVAWIISSEISFSLFVKYEGKKDWVQHKLCSLFLGFAFIMVNFLVVFFNLLRCELDKCTKLIDYWGNGNYKFLLCLYGGIGILFLFFYLNKKLADWIERKNGKNNKRNKRII